MGIEDKEEEPLSPGSAKKRRLWKLRRQLGQSVPPEVVYGDHAAFFKYSADAFATRKSGVSYEWEEDSGFGEDETSDDESEVVFADPGTTPKQAGIIKHTDVHAAFVGGLVSGAEWEAVDGRERLSGRDQRSSEAVILSVVISLFVSFYFLA